MTRRDSSVSDLYDRWASTYDSDNNATRDLDAIVLRGAELPITGRDVCELGCGTGKNTAWLVEHAARVLALDASDGMLAIARSRVPSDRVVFQRHDILEPWPTPSDAFDVVVANLVLEHIADVRPIFLETARVLRPAGTAFFCELHPYRQLRGSQARFADPQSGETLYVPAFTHTVSEFVNAGLEAGLRLKAIGEHLERGAERGNPPRLLSLRFEASAARG